MCPEVRTHLYVDRVLQIQDMYIPTMNHMNDMEERNQCTDQMQQMLASFARDCSASLFIYG